MSRKQSKNKTLIAKFNKIKTRNETPFLKMGGGIFTPKTRLKILDLLQSSETKETDNYLNNFWYDQRNRVEIALIDLALFIEAAGTGNVNQVVTAEALEHIVYALLHNPLVDTPNQPNVVRAEIARLFIEFGLGYLSAMKPENVTLSHRRTIREAIDLSRFLADSFKHESQKRYYPSGEEE